MFLSMCLSVSAENKHKIPDEHQIKIPKLERAPVKGCKFAIAAKSLVIIPAETSK